MTIGLPDLQSVKPLFRSDAPWLWVMHPSEPLQDASVGMVSRTEACQLYAPQRESRLDEIVR